MPSHRNPPTLAAFVQKNAANRQDAGDQTRHTQRLHNGLVATLDGTLPAARHSYYSSWWSCRMRYSKRHGLTFIELVVVIAIIAILVLLLLPADAASLEPGSEKGNQHPAVLGTIEFDGAPASLGPTEVPWRMSLLLGDKTEIDLSASCAILDFAIPTKNRHSGT